MDAFPASGDSNSGSCPVCAAEFAAASAVVCPACLFLIGELGQEVSGLPDRLLAEDFARPLAGFCDSMEFVELLVEWEESRPDLAALVTSNQVRTLGEVLRWLRGSGPG